MSTEASIIIATAVAGILMMRFRKRWLAKINIAFTKSHHPPVRRLASRLQHTHACGSQVGKGLSDSG